MKHLTKQLGLATLIVMVFAGCCLRNTVSATAADGGVIVPSGDVVVFYNQSETFTITPDEGYVVADVIVDGASVGQVTTYTFTRVVDNHSIDVVFSLDEPVPDTGGGNGGMSF